MNATATTPTVPTVPGALARAVSDIAVITHRNLLFTLRLPQVLVLSAIMPVIFIVMFTYVFGGAIQGALPPAAAGRYVNWLIPPRPASAACSARWRSACCSATPGRG